MKKFVKSICSILGFSLGFAWKTSKTYILLKIIQMIPDVLNSILIVSIPRYIIDSLSENNDIKMALTYTGALILTMILYTLLTGAIESFLSIKNMRLNRRLSERLQQAVVQMPYAEFERRQTLDDFSTIREFVSEISVSSVLDTVFSVFSNILKAISYIYIVLEYSWLFIFVVIVSIVVKILCQNREETELFRLQKKTAPLERRIGYASRSVMDYSNAKEVRVFGLHDFIVDKFNIYMKAMYENEFSSIRKLSPLKIATAFTEALFLLTAYGSIGWSLYRGVITVGVFTQYTGAFFSLGAALSAVVSAIVTLKNQNNYVASYLEFVKGYDGAEISAPQAEIMPREKPKIIELVNLSFRYPGAEDFVLKGLSLRFELGEKIAIVGKNGAGKTTLIKLLLRLYSPTEGKILLDGTDINDIPADEYFRIFSVAFQDCSLFNYSVRENIAFDRPMDWERMERIIGELGLRERIERQPGGLNTFVTRTLDEAGSDFSGGERKKILIARALYKNAGVYIFDEPTAELSPRSELLIYDAIFSSSELRTVFFISHRLASCKRCSRIIVFDGGTVVGDGTHEALMAEGGLYAEMFNAQADSYGEGD